MFEFCVHGRGSEKDMYICIQKHGYIHENTYSYDMYVYWDFTAKEAILRWCVNATWCVENKTTELNGCMCRTAWTSAKLAHTHTNK